LPIAPQPHNDQYEQKRRAFLNEAGALLEESGIENFSLAKLAERLNITSAALYYYFKNKQDVIFECYALSFDLADAALDGALTVDGSCSKRLERFIYDYMLAALRSLQPTMSLRENTTLLPAYDARIRQRRNRLHKRLRELVAQGIAEQSINPCDPALTIIAIIGAIRDLLRVYDPRKKMQPEDIAAQVASQLTHGVTARRSSKKAVHAEKLQNPKRSRPQHSGTEHLTRPRRRTA
jgi:AcrR family transcriptional regulator